MQGILKKLQKNNFSTQSEYVFIYIFKIRIKEIYASAVMECAIARTISNNRFDNRNDDFDGSSDHSASEAMPC